MGWFFPDYKEDFSDLLGRYKRFWDISRPTTFLRGAETHAPPALIEGLHKHPDIWNNLSERQKETMDILDTRLIGMPTAAIIAAGAHYSAMCEKQNMLYVLGKSEFQDPRSTLRLGKDISDCAAGTFEFILTNCADSFKDFYHCVDDYRYKTASCRSQQFAFDLCMSDNGIEKNRVMLRECIIQDEDVPWTPPKNPLNLKTIPATNNHVDYLRPLGISPSHEMMADYIRRKNEGTESKQYDTKYANRNVSS